MSFTGTPYITVDPATGQVVAQYPDGSVVPVESAPAPAIVNEGAPNAVQGTSGASGPVTDPLWFATESTQGTDSVSGGYGSGGYSRRGYSRGGYSNDYADQNDIPQPRYGTGELHPAWGGDRRIPGGYFALNDSGDDYRPPLGSDYVPSPRSYGGSGDSGGGGGGDVAGLISAWRSRLIGGLYPGGGGSSSGYSSGGGGTQEERMRGPYAKGLDPTQAAGLSLRPTAMLPRVFSDISGEMPIYQRLASLPAAQLAMLRGGYSGSTEDLANNLGKVYHDAAAGKLPSTQKLMGNLASGKGIEQMFEGVKAGRGDMESYTTPGYVYGQEPLMLGEAATTFGGLLDAALINEPLLTQAKYGSAPGGWGSYLTDKWASKALKKPVGKGVPVNRYVTRRLFK